jgi:tRNA pseudouridine-54 N-methylase
VFPNHQANTLPDANQLMLMHQQQGNKQNIEAVNAERRKVIADESAMLLKLATDLKAEVDKSNKDTLSLTVIRRADMVEKLAHDMKEKMKLSIAAN